MKKSTLPIIVALIASSGVLQASNINGRAVPQSKRTSLGLYLTAADAFEKWKADPRSVKIVDVRTPEEFRRTGYPSMASLVPLSSRADEFVGRVSRIARPDETVLVICRSGNRSAAAVDMLAKAGFKQAYSVVDGFEGDRNANRLSLQYGQRTINGWKNAGLPWTKGGER